jgi:hypothetical protein
MTIVNEEKGPVTVQEGKYTFLNCHVESGNPMENFEWKRANETMLFGGPKHSGLDSRIAVALFHNCF